MSKFIFIIFSEILVNMAQTGFNGPPPLTDDDQFDLDLKEALGETPSLNDLGMLIDKIKTLNVKINIHGSVVLSKRFQLLAQ